jgi:hypothetical protein
MEAGIILYGSSLLLEFVALVGPALYWLTARIRSIRRS